jgi:hypothetical protein
VVPRHLAGEQHVDQHAHMLAEHDSGLRLDRGADGLCGRGIDVDKRQEQDKD